MSAKPLKDSATPSKVSNDFIEQKSKLDKNIILNDKDLENIEENPVVSIVKLSGKLLTDDLKLVSTLLELKQYQEESGHHIVLVHGGGVYCDEWCEQWQLPVTKQNGIRVTQPIHLPVITGALSGYAHMKVISACKKVGINPLGMTPSTGNTLNCELHAEHEKLGRVGTVVPNDPSFVYRLFATNYWPVFHSLAIDEFGECLNVNADDIASALSLALNAKQLIILTDVDGVLDPSGNVLEKIASTDIPDLIQSKVVSDGMVAKLSALSNLLNASLDRIVITSANNPLQIRSRLSGHLPATEIVAQSSTQGISL